MDNINRIYNDVIEGKIEQKAVDIHMDKVAEAKKQSSTEDYWATWIYYPQTQEFIKTLKEAQVKLLSRAMCLSSTCIDKDAERLVLSLNAQAYVIDKILNETIKIGTY